MPQLSASESMNVAGASPSLAHPWTTSAPSAGRDWRRKRDEGQVGFATVTRIPTDHLTVTVRGQSGLHLGRLS